MKKMMVDSLPRKFNHIDWINSVGKKVEFIYDDIGGFVTIIGYNKQNSMVLFEYNGIEKEVFSGSFVNCSIGSVLNKRTSEYRFEIGDVVNGMIVVEKKRYGKNKVKSYHVKCLKCGYENVNSTENNILKGKGCAVCSGRKCVVGVNDIATTHPHLVEYFLNKQDAQSHTAMSGKRVNVACPICGEEKDMVVSHITEYGVSCKVCGDGISYPEKYVTSLLKQCMIVFETQYKISNYKYDFYIPSLNMIIETHGLQHYSNGTGYYNKKLPQIQQNDRYKMERALSCGIDEYIILDCRISDGDYIKNSILKSNILNKFDKKDSDINWEDCKRNATRNIIEPIVNEWNNRGEDEFVADISNRLNISKSTCIKYLKLGNELGLCEYDAKLEMQKSIKSSKRDKSKSSKKVVCDGIEFKSIVECSSYYEVNARTMAKWLKGVTRMPLIFKEKNLSFK